MYRMMQGLVRVEGAAVRAQKVVPLKSNQPVLKATHSSGSGGSVHSLQLEKTPSSQREVFQPSNTLKQVCSGGNPSSPIKPPPATKSLEGDLQTMGLLDETKTRLLKSDAPSFVAATPHSSNHIITAKKFSSPAVAEFSRDLHHSGSALSSSSLLSTSFTDAVSAAKLRFGFFNDSDHAFPENDLAFLSNSKDFAPTLQMIRQMYGRSRSLSLPRYQNDSNIDLTQRSEDMCNVKKKTTACSKDKVKTQLESCSNSKVKTEPPATPKTNKKVENSRAKTNVQQQKSRSMKDSSVTRCLETNTTRRKSSKDVSQKIKMERSKEANRLAGEIRDRNKPARMTLENYRKKFPSLPTKRTNPINVGNKAMLSTSTRDHAGASPDRSKLMSHANKRKAGTPLDAVPIKRKRFVNEKALAMNDVEAKKPEKSDAALKDKKQKRVEEFNREVEEGLRKLNENEEYDRTMKRSRKAGFLMNFKYAKPTQKSDTELAGGSTGSAPPALPNKKESETDVTLSKKQIRKIIKVMQLLSVKDGKTVTDVDIDRAVEMVTASDLQEALKKEATRRAATEDTSDTKEKQETAKSTVTSDSTAKPPKLLSREEVGSMLSRIRERRMKEVYDQTSPASTTSSSQAEATEVEGSKDGDETEEKPMRQALRNEQEGQDHTVSESTVDRRSKASGADQSKSSPSSGRFQGMLRMLRKKRSDGDDAMDTDALTQEEDKVRAPNEDIPIAEKARTKENLVAISQIHYAKIMKAIEEECYDECEDARFLSRQDYTKELRNLSEENLRRLIAVSARPDFPEILRKLKENNAAGIQDPDLLFLAELCKCSEDAEMKALVPMCNFDEPSALVILLKNQGKKWRNSKHMEKLRKLLYGNNKSS